MGERPRTRYARCDELDIAFQVLGEGQRDMLLFPGWAIPIDCMDDEPALARYERRLSEYCRLIRLDVRGMGLSDRGSATDAPGIARWADDGLCVLDAVGSERATVFAPFRHAPVGVMLAAAHPERVSSLIIVNGFARIGHAPDYEFGLPQEAIDEALLMAAEPDATDRGFDPLARMSPSMATDASFRAWWDRSGNLGTTPAMARALLRQSFEVDVRDLLPKVGVPTLVLHRTEAAVPEACGRFLAEHISGATYVELPGADTLFWTGDVDEMLGQIEEFITGERGGLGTERVLATVMFTDVVGSTARAAGLGDSRWRDLLDLHDARVRHEIGRFRGRAVSTTGDGFFAAFDSPRQAIECAQAIRATLLALNLGVRAGIHTGEIEVRGDDLAGLTVHIGARVTSVAGPGEILVSSTVRDLLVGSTIEFTERGEHELKGVPGTWRLFAVAG